MQDYPQWFRDMARDWNDGDGGNFLLSASYLTQILIAFEEGVRIGQYIAPWHKAQLEKRLQEIPGYYETHHKLTELLFLHVSEIAEY